jgi:hypothetical protein
MFKLKDLSYGSSGNVIMIDKMKEAVEPLFL